MRGMWLTRIAFGIGEVFINLSTGLAGALVPMYIARGMAPPGIAVPEGPFTLFAMHAYAALITLLGLTEAVVMWRADRRVVRATVACLLVGDILHLTAWLPGFLPHPVWNSASIGTLGVIGALIPLRLLALALLRAPRGAGAATEARA